MRYFVSRSILLSFALAAVGLAGCMAGTNNQTMSGDGGLGGSSAGNAGRSGASGAAGSTGLGGTSPTTGVGGNSALPLPPGCGDGINNQGGIEACDDGNTLAGDGCNGACQTEPNWACPAAGACMRSFRCGDSVINPGEVCDDGNAADGDGCSANCSVQTPGYICTPGRLCTSTSVCGNRRIEPGETCDDGNTTANDGCSASCVLQPGYQCPAPGSPCMPMARCGDSTVNVNLGEVCDDGNTANGDGCSNDCRIRGAGCSCQPGMLCVCPEVRCGNGTIEGTERCDDNNAVAGDGCSATCQLETGYACPLVRAPCVPDCGDGRVIAGEQCDPGVNVPNMNMACSATCRWNPGWACTGNPPTECHRSTCGDGRAEGLEACDDGNTMPWDGCSTDCKNEPSCPTGAACMKKCGDGVVLGEACDDGNLLAGDGCSATCQPESGYTCPSGLGASIQVPVVYRDFLAGHIDFEPGVTGSTTASTGLVNAMLDTEGKPTLVGAGGGWAGISNAANFAQWYRNVANVNHATPTTMTLWNNGMGAYVNRWGPNGEQWQRTQRADFCGNRGEEVMDPVTGLPLPCTFRFGNTNCDQLTAMGLMMLRCFLDGNSYRADFLVEAMDGTPVFFPVDGDNFTPAAERATAQVPPPYAANWVAEMPAAIHNFHFTSEVRYWFPYTAGQTYRLDFLGDDDVWVFVNNRLAVDLGGVHTPVAGAVTINNANAFGMTTGNVYQIVVFQAERQKTSSSYKLTLSGFAGATSVCGPTCGDRVVTAGEQCDNGTAMNLGGYNQCTAQCRLGPYCGDAMVDAANETCDNGRNDDAYNAASGCGPGCKLPARCGDMLVQAEYGETCDNGPTGNTGAYGSCTTQCQRAGYCGDGMTQSPQESCDDGANDGTYGTCGDSSMPLPNCGPAPRCGDGTVQDAYGEQCEPTATNDPTCTSACKRPGICGDAVVTAPEQCDYGETMNTGAYGGCAPGCNLAPHCGDAIKNGPEECDDGVRDNSYGGCTQQCKRAAYCGDGMVATGYEQCDDGPANGTNNRCTTTCKVIVQ